MRIRIALTGLIGIVMLLKGFIPSISQTNNYLKREIDVPECKVEHLETAMASIITDFGGKEDLFSRIKPKFEQFRKCYDAKRIGYCLKKYINAELDFTTPGNRGYWTNNRTYSSFRSLF